MALSTCVKCGGTVFEVQVKEQLVLGSNFKLTFIQCASCGGVVGVMDYWNIGERLTDLAAALGVRLPD